MPQRFRRLVLEKLDYQGVGGFSVTWSISRGSKMAQRLGKWLPTRPEYERARGSGGPKSARNDPVVRFFQNRIRARALFRLWKSRTTLGVMSS